MIVDTMLEREKMSFKKKFHLLLVFLYSIKYLITSNYNKESWLIWITYFLNKLKAKDLNNFL